MSIQTRLNCLNRGCANRYGDYGQIVYCRYMCFCKRMVHVWRTLKNSTYKISLSGSPWNIRVETNPSRADNVQLLFLWVDHAYQIQIIIKQLGKDPIPPSPLDWWPSEVLCQVIAECLLSVTKFQQTSDRYPAIAQTTSIDGEKLKCYVLPLACVMFLAGVIHT